MLKMAAVVTLVLGAAVLAGWLAPAGAAQRHKTCEDVCGVNYVAVWYRPGPSVWHPHRGR